MKRRTLYLPVETKCRELLGKTLLAAKAVERGWRVFLGGVEMHDYMGDDFPPGLFIENNIPDSKAERLYHMRARGCRIADMCEESVQYRHSEEYWNRKVGDRSLQATDVILATGVKSEQDLRRHRGVPADQLSLTGNPRFDVLMSRLRCVFDNEVRAIRERYGRFLLVNSNFSAANPFTTVRDVIGTLQRAGKLSTPAQVDWKRRQISYKARQMADLRTLLLKVASAGAFDRIVLRPHPTENHDFWRTWGSALNVDVRYDANACPWMLAADMVLHPGCTTAVEAVLLDRPPVSFVPEPESEFLNLADEISVKVASADELLALTEEWRRNGEAWRPHLVAGRSALRTRIDNVEPPLAADRILDVCDRLDVPETGTARYVLKRARGALSIGRRRSKRAALQRTQFGFRRQKFPGLDLADVRTPVSRWVAAGVLGQIPEIAHVGGSLMRFQ